MNRKLFIFGAILAAACARDSAVPASTPTPASPAANAQNTPTPKQVVPSNVDPRSVQRAKKLVREAKKLYEHGRYDQAETKLRDSIHLYPFLPQANVLMGKVLLIRGAANRDASLLSSARLMFEMALAMAPRQPEASVLIELFGRDRVY